MKQIRVELTCRSCGTKKTFPASSPAAPALTASEASAEEGWSFSVGFFAMLTGDHQNLCPACTTGWEKSTSTKIRCGELDGEAP